MRQTEKKIRTRIYGLVGGRSEWSGLGPHIEENLIPVRLISCSRKCFAKFRFEWHVLYAFVWLEFLLFFFNDTCRINSTCFPFTNRHYIEHHCLLILVTSDLFIVRHAIHQSTLFFFQRKYIVFFFEEKK